MIECSCGYESKDTVEIFNHIQLAIEKDDTEEHIFNLEVDFLERDSR